VVINAVGHFGRKPANKPPLGHCARRRAFNQLATQRRTHWRAQTFARKQTDGLSK
jgi:hypothetical protein